MLSNADCTIVDMEPEPECQTIVTSQTITTISEETAVCASSLEVISFERKSTEEWKGKPLSEMNSLFNSECQESVKIEPGRAHTVLFKVIYFINLDQFSI